MSIFDTPADSTPAPDAGASTPVDAGSGAAPEGAPVVDPGTEVSVEPQYVDLDSMGEHLVKIKVGGEEVERPLKDVIKSDMLQQDYTRKTQALAEQQRRLQQADMLVAALESDPVGTLKQLSEAYDLDPNAGLQPVERAPEEQRLIDMQRQFEAQQQQFNRQRIEQEVQLLTTKYGQEFDLRGAAQLAQQRGTTLTVAAELMEAENLRKSQAEAAEAERRRQAAQGAQVVHDGTATQRGAVSTPQSTPGSIREAWRAAKAATK